MKFEEAGRARIPFPIEIVFGVAAAFQVQTALLARRAVREGDMIVGDILKEVDFLLFQQQACGDGVHRGVAPTLVEETAILVELVKVVEVGRRAQPVEIPNFKVGPLQKEKVNGSTKVKQDQGERLTKWQWL